MLAIRLVAAVAFHVVPTRKTTSEIFHITFTSCVHQTIAVSTSIAPATGSFLDRQQGRMLPVSIWIVQVPVISAQRQGVSGSEGGMLAAVDLISAVVELDDLVESVDWLVALGGGQPGGNSSFSWVSLSLSSCFLAKVFTSFGYGWAHSRMRVLLVWL
eukprot:scaffold74665_cov57-Attheya_sp.AAC.1